MGEIRNVLKLKCLKGISQQDRAEQDPINVNGLVGLDPFNSYIFRFQSNLGDRHFASNLAARTLHSC